MRFRQLFFRLEGCGMLIRPAFIVLGVSLFITKKLQNFFQFLVNFVDICS